MPGIVGRNHHQRAVQPRIRHGKQRIGGHIQAHVLHGHQGARAGKGHADAHLQRHFLVGRPLRPPAQSFEGFENLRRGRAGISRAELHAAFKGGHGNGFVAAQ